MNRVQTDERPATFCHILKHRFEIAKIPNTPVFFRSQRIKLNAGTPQLLFIQQRLRFVTAFRGDNHPAMRALVVLGKRQRVITFRQLRR